MNHEEAIFSATVALPAADRPAFLDRVCAGDRALRERLEALLRAHDEANSFMKSAAPGVGETVAAFAPRPEEKTGDRIGRYKLLQQIGEGGCGVVYMAEQTEPVVRRVALKVIKLGMDTKAVIARFEAERQALAMMDHPNIAKVLDAGTTDNGRPFFVMELVRGIPITKYCDEANLSTAARLGLFDQVCHAIQHAHQKGIIHRDIKPSNILVTLHDGEPVPKVIDFGIAKATQGKLTDATVFTAFEQFIGTPAYMSPEQAEMSGLDIDTRSDIYSLGVLLYELLTGRPPFDPKSFVEAGLDEMRRMIREVEPPKPSTRLNTLTVADRATVAKLRGAQPAQLRSQLSGDLDWIVMKALEKNRTRRYESASAFAADLQRHINNEPVVARPPSATYLIQKLVRRHRFAFAAAAAIAAALAVGFGVSTWEFFQEKAARVNEARQRALAEAEEQKAKTEAARSKQAFNLVGKMLFRAGPSMAAGRDTTLLREILDETAEDLDTDLKDQPAVQVQVRALLAPVYRDLGDYPKAEAMAQAALALSRQLNDAGHDDQATALTVLSFLRFAQGNLLESETLSREAVAIFQKLPPDQGEGLPGALSLLGSALSGQGKFAEAERVYRKADAFVSARPDAHRQMPAGFKTELASTLQQQGKFAEAETVLRRAIADEMEHLDRRHSNVVAGAIAALSNLLQQEGRPQAEIEVFYRDAIVAMKARLGNEHPVVAELLRDQAFILLWQGRESEAEPMFREAFAILKKSPVPDAVRVGDTLLGLALALQVQNKLAEAGAITETAVSLLKTAPVGLSPQTPRLADLTLVLATLKSQQGNTTEGQALAREAATIDREQPDGRRGNGTRMLTAVASRLEQLGRAPEAVTVRRVVLQFARDRDGAESAAAALQVAGLGALLNRTGRFEEAEPLARESWELRKKLLPANNWFIFSSECLVGETLLGQRKYAEAEPLLLAAFTDLLQHAPNPADPSFASWRSRLPDAANRLVQLYDATGQPAKAAEWKKNHDGLTAPKQPAS